ncbi:MAG: cache domain-containing protein, partial [Thermodesulfovibrionales bacterium]
MNNTIFRAFNLNTIVIISLCFTAILSFWLYEDYGRTKNEIKEIENIHIEDQKIIIKRHILKLSNYIEESRKQFYKHAGEHIKSRTDEAYFIASSLYNYYKDKKSLDEIKEMVKEALRQKRTGKSSRGYYFVLNINGTIELFADMPEMEGRNLINIRDPDGRYFMKDMIKIARTEGEGFYEYRWTKPGGRGAYHKKISYLKYFSPFEWVLSSGEYIEDLDRDFTEQTISLLQDMQGADGSYLFAIDFNGRCFVHAKRDFIGKSLIELRDKENRPIIKEMIELGKKGGGYVTYLWENPNSGDIMPKI